jgi:hypothetical protein
MAGLLVDPKFANQNLKNYQNLARVHPRSGRLAIRSEMDGSSWIFLSILAHPSFVGLCFPAIQPMTD